MINEKYEKYLHTEMYRVIDSIGVPHPYCITPKHVAVAADQFGGMLGEPAIIEAEKQGAVCCICKGKLSYKQHEQALLIEVKFNGELKDAPNLKEYLLSIKDMATEGKFAGFAFKQVTV